MRIVPLLAGLASAVVCVSLQAAEERPIVSEIRVEITPAAVGGAPRVSEDRVRFLLTTRVGDALDLLALADDVRALEALGPFTRIEAAQIADPGDRRRVVVVFKLVELQYIGAVRFAGLNYFQRSGLEDKIRSKPGDYLNPLVLENDRMALERYFHEEKGNLDARVTVETPTVEGIATVIFNIERGREIDVGTVRYEGLPAAVLPRTVTAALINQPNRPYQPEMVELDEQAVARTLQDLGWLDAAVGTSSRDRFDYVRPHEDRRRHGPALAPDGAFDDRVVLTFPITAGDLWYLGSVSFVGNTVASEAELRAAFALPDGAIYRRKDIEGAVEKAQRVIRNLGYARANLRIDRRPDTTEHKVHLTLHAFEGDLYTLDRVDIHGNYRTKDAVARRALRVHPGARWNEDDVDRSKRTLVNTGLFKSQPPAAPRLSPRFDDDRPGHVDLVVDLEEDSTGQFRFQVGYSSAFGVFGELGYQERNFDLFKALTFSGWRGAGHVLDLNASASEERTSTGISWTNPHLLDGPYSLSVSFNRSDSSRLDWDELRTSPSVSIGRSFLDGDLKLNLGYTYTDLQIDEVDDDATDDALVGEGDYYLNTLSLRQSYDRLDHPRLPTAGFRLSTSEAVTGGPLSSSADYYEWSAKGDAFIPLYTMALGGSIVLHLSERWQEMGAFGDTDDVPFYDRYYGGGPSPRHRGFESGRLSPYAINANALRARTGGTTDSLASAELVIPLQGENDKIRLVLFSDVGNVWGEDESVSLNDLRTAVGFGIRFPVQLPVALDFAWLLDAEEEEADNQIHFALGFFSY
ncbi:MAG: outer membrane protein assembly factor BamA [Planctomycetes bacterium]|nr:outer membrane protein assembly factor BamA [Planctomycetota bacterium]